MVKTSSSATQKRKPRILWANPFCLLDSSSGASMTVRQMLLQLVAHGYEVQVLGATVFDNPKGMGKLKEQFPDLNAHLHQLIEAQDGPLTHQLVVSYSHNRNHFTTHEEGLWYSQYIYLLDSFKPDVVWFYGGLTVDMLIADEARDRGIATAFYLANGNYKSSRWCRDIDLILTDSQATADMYCKEVGFVAKPVGKFIASDRFIAEEHERKRLLFVNPSWQKGASIFVQLAEKLERERADIELEVVEARADWPAVLREITRKMGKQRGTLSNVTVTANTSDMRGPYSRARVLVAPSLWWESSGRVLAEAMLNGIPALITNRGGMPEMIGDAGIAFDFPDACYEEPYHHLLSDEELQPLADAVINFFDDEDFYQDYVARAWQVGKEKHHLDRATDRLIGALTPLVGQRAGNKDFTIIQRKRHRQRLASRATKPEFKVDNSLQQLVAVKPGTQQIKKEQQAGRLSLTDDFTWQIKGKIMVLDNRASLLKSSLADQMAATEAFGIVAFDPASEIKDAKQYEGSDYIQLFQHALLGDGKAATLHACVAPEMTSTLSPLPPEKLSKRHQLGARLLAELPINTVALDSIEGLGNLDWLILDELSDAITILEHGKQSLTNTLLIQARVSFQPTHEKQPSLAEFQHWASRNGFRFYRFHNISHYSHLPEKLSAQTACATEQESGDVLFLPSHERMAELSEKERMKLAFMLSAGFAAHDVAFDLIAGFSQEKALEFLEAQKFLPKVQTPPKDAGPLDPKNLEGVNLHIMVMEKFIAPYIEFITQYIPDAKNHYVITGNKVFAYGLKKEHGVEFINSEEGFFRLENYMYYADKIIFHGLWSENAYSLLIKKPEFYSKTYWLPWGGDFYFPERHSKTKKEVIRNIENIISFVDPDVDYVRKRYGAKGYHHKKLSYPLSLFDEDYAKPLKKKGKINVLVGNSAFETSNHIEAFQKIKCLADKDVIIYVPLSYGPKSNAEKVIHSGNKIFKEKLFPITDYMDKFKYKDFLKCVDMAFYCNDRQQGLGNINLLLSMGKKVFMKKGTPNWRHYSSLGFNIYDIDAFNCNCLFLNGFDKDNVDLARKVFGKEEYKLHWGSILL